MRKMFKKVILAAVGIFICVSVYSNVKPITLKVYLAGGSTELESSKEVIKMFTDKNPDIKVDAIRAPFDTDQMYSTYLQLFESKSSDLDLITLDSSWTRGMANNLVDLTKYENKEYFSQYYPSIMKSYEVDKHIVAFPWYSDIGLLYYRTDLLKKYNLEVPKTWIELTKAAFVIQQGERKEGNKDFEGFVWQGQEYEGLSCNAIEWIYNNDGGTIINDNKEITINNPNAIEALKLAVNWIGTISPRGVLSMTEDQSKDAFMSGNVAFLRSWPYIYSICNVEGSAIKGKYDATLIPTGKLGKNSGVLGGWGIGVNKYSKNKDAAVKLAKFLTSPEAQKYRALKSGNAPNILSLKEDKDLMKVPIFRIVNKAFETGFNRPFIQAYPHYNAVSQAFYKTVYSILKKDTTPYAGMQGLESSIKQITKYPVKK
jgi:trehalose/maltose transport system substrate-binding protein